MNRKLRNAIMAGTAGLIIGLVVGAETLRRSVRKTIRTLTDGFFEPLYRDVKTDKNEEV
jgi:hypothetical protein